MLAAGNLLGPSVLWLVEDVVESFRGCGLDHPAVIRPRTPAAPETGTGHNG
ncbi:hypothetical protein GCM10010470_56430 [Saccharopolyspora taberi]|uniref:Uncharacterized protein n=1 Tax=Saccharopolyspora taberi TaxID=60895 RepID=A0ABN3VKJ3_9PSEU